MTNKEIKLKAISILKDKWGRSITLTVVGASFFLIYAIFEYIIYISMKFMDPEYEFSIKTLISTNIGKSIFVLRVLYWLLFLVPVFWMLRRAFLELYAGRDYLKIRWYFQNNVRLFFVKSIETDIILFFMRLVMLLPSLLGMFGFYYLVWARKGIEFEFTQMIVILMVLVFIVMWVCLWIYYCISLSLTKYILMLNPRAKIFEACDLSVKLMKGRHIEYIKFMFSFLIYLPFLVFIYPFFVIFPYFRISYLIFIQNIMGKYWCDKLPGMIQRWSKHED